MFLGFFFVLHFGPKIQAYFLFWRTNTTRSSQDPIPTIYFLEKKNSLTSLFPPQLLAHLPIFSSLLPFSHVLFSIHCSFIFFSHFCSFLPISFFLSSFFSSYFVLFLFSSSFLSTTPPPPMSGTSAHASSPTTTSYRQPCMSSPTTTSHRKPHNRRPLSNHFIPHLSLIFYLFIYLFIIIIIHFLLFFSFFSFCASP